MLGSAAGGAAAVAVRLAAAAAALCASRRLTLKGRGGGSERESEGNKEKEKNSVLELILKKANTHTTRGVSRISGLLSRGGEKRRCCLFRLYIKIEESPHLFEFPNRKKIKRKAFFVR